MIIQSRKHPDKTWDVTLETWNKIKKNGDSRKYRVLSSVDVPVGEVATPVEVQNFLNDRPEVRKVYEKEEDLNALRKDELIEKYPHLDLNNKMLKEEIIDKIIKQ